jgi:ribose-phosphate pyrophosphokinase
MKKIIISTPNYSALTERLRAKLNQISGGNVFGHLGDKHIETSAFPDGEIYDKITTNVEGQDIIFVAGTVDETDTMEIYHIGSALANQGAKSITFVIPYFGYSTMERAVKDGEIVKAKNVARLLSSIPHGSGRSNRFVLVDLHSADIQHYFEGSAQTKHVYAKPLVIDLCHQIAGNDFVLGSTDAGRAKWVESLAKDMNVGCAIIIKRRNSGSDTEVTGMNADVKDKTVIIYDDMIRTGGSIVKAAKTYMEAGAKDVYAIATHGVLPGAYNDPMSSAIFKMQASGQIKKVYVTDTHPMAEKLSKIRGSLTSFLQVVSIADVLGNSLYPMLINENELKEVLA